MLFRVFFRRVLVVFGCMQGMAVGHLGVVRGFLMMAGFMVLRGLAMVLGGFLVVVRRLLMMLMNFVAIHWLLPGSSLAADSSLAANPTSPGSM